LQPSLPPGAYFLSQAERGLHLAASCSSDGYGVWKEPFSYGVFLPLQHLTHLA